MNVEVRSQVFRRAIVMVIAVLVCGLFWLAGVGRVEAASLRAGVAVENITAEKPAVPVNDPLYAKTLVVGDGSRKLVIICLDITGTSGTLVTAIRGRLREELGIDETNVLINASHNHHTQGQTARDLVQRTVRAVRRASENMVPVKIGVAAGREERITMSRRLGTSDGTAWTIRRANPSPKDSHVEHLGPVDPEIGVLRLDTLSGEPLAVVYNFAAHAYGGVPDGSVTADLPGFASAVLEKALGGSATALFLQGAAGDITPIRYKDVDAPQPTEHLGTLLGLSTLEAVNRISTAAEGTLTVVSQTIELPRRHDLAQRIQSLEQQQEEILQFFTGIGCGTHGAGTFLNFKTFLPLYLKHLVDPEHPAYSSYLYLHEEAIGRDDLEHLDAENRTRVEKYLACIEQMERLIRIRSNLHILARHEEKGHAGPILAEVQGVRIGQFVLVTFPGELFAEVGLRIKERSPFEYTFVAGYANGHLGYAPTAEAYEDGAYEDSLTPFAPQWQEIYEAKALEIIDQLATPGE